MFLTLWISIFSVVSLAANLDARILRFVNTPDQPWYDLSEPVISGDWFAYAIGLSSVLIDPEQGALSAGLTGLEVLGMKTLLKRPRPFKTFSWVKDRVSETGYSMPSGHSAMAFEAAYIWSERFPQFSVLFYSLATYVAVSRVYYGVHYPSDVVVGAAIGYFTARLVSDLFTSQGSDEKALKIEFQFNLR